MLEMFTRFEGRIDRKQWWWAQTLIAMVLLPVLAWIWIRHQPANFMAFLDLPQTNAAMLLALVAGLAPTVKRYHDLDKSGWWAILSFVPFASFWLLYECGFRASFPAPNRYDVVDVSQEPEYQTAWMFF
jgi:uncharacterized membrane protein YhaH (DUF805 family)